MNELVSMGMTSNRLPQGWQAIADPESDEFIAVPDWLFEKMLTGRVTEKEFQDYRHACFDLQIDEWQKNKQSLN